MSWGSKASNKGDNDCTCTDPQNESKECDYKHGHFYDGNNTKNAQEDNWGQGSEGLERNQGFVRDSMIPTADDGVMGQDNETRLKEQGSHAHMGVRENKVSREL